MRDEDLKSIMLSILQNPMEVAISPDEAEYICGRVTQILLKEPTVLEIDPPINICGDIHGQIGDLISIFDQRNCGFGPDTKFLFLGDYVDRGPNSVEVICLLFTMKILFPANVFLLRGNHESPEMTEYFGFREECEKKKLSGALCSFYNAFDALPISAVVGKKIFCVHGGLSQSLNFVKQIQEIQRPTAIPEDGILADLLWSDPSKRFDYWGPNERGSTITYGPKAVREFLDRNGLSMIIRGHQMAQNGVDYPYAPIKTVITVFTASNYAGAYKNLAGFVSVDENINVSLFAIVDDNNQMEDDEEDRD